MLARANRVVRGDDFRSTMRRGRRIPFNHAVIFLVDREHDGPARFGFVISKAVGGAVVRNTLRRRFRATARELVDEGFAGHDVVIRALPGCSALDWTSLHSEITEAIEKGSRR